MEFKIPVVRSISRKGRVSRETLSLNAMRSKGQPHRWYCARKKEIDTALNKQLTGNEPKELDKIAALHYIIGCTGKQDVMNIGSIADKFFQDWLVSSGILKDDTVHNVNYITFVGIHSPSGAFARVSIEL